MRPPWIAFTLILGTLGLTGCGDEFRTMRADDFGETCIVSPAQIPSRVVQPRQLQMVHDEPYLPPHHGREQLLHYCTICHSLRYVTSQPAFSRKVWASEVSKMVKAYGAPVPEEHIPAIVEYLTWRSGRETE